jgi:hypothetical protein
MVAASIVVSSGIDYPSMAAFADSYASIIAAF